MDFQHKNKQQIEDLVKHKLPVKSSFSNVIKKNYTVRGEFLHYFDDKRNEFKKNKILRRVAETSNQQIITPKVLSQSLPNQRNEEKAILTNHIKKALHVGLNSTVPPHTLLMNHYWRIYQINYSDNLKKAKIIYISTEERVDPKELETVINNNLPFLNQIIRTNFSLTDRPIPVFKFALGSEQAHMFDNALELIEQEVNEHDSNNN